MIEDSEDDDARTSSNLASRTRKSLRLSTPHPNGRILNSRVVSSDSIKSRLHYNRQPVVETIKKEKSKKEIKKEIENELKIEIKEETKPVRTY